MGPELAVGQGHAEPQRCNLRNLRVLRTHERHADLLRRAGWAIHGVGSVLQQLVGERHSRQVDSPTWAMTSASPHPAPTLTMKDPSKGLGKTQRSPAPVLLPHHPETRRNVGYQAAR